MLTSCEVVVGFSQLSFCLLCSPTSTSRVLSSKLFSSKQKATVHSEGEASAKGAPAVSVVRIGMIRNSYCLTGYAKSNTTSHNLTTAPCQAVAKLWYILKLDSPVWV